MIVFDLRCSQNHVFEAWFANSQAFLDQRDRKLLACPYCATHEVDKAVMAPNVGAKGNAVARAKPIPVAKSDDPPATEIKGMLEKVAKLQNEMLAKSEWVGRDFDKKARAMDAGEIPHQAVHGEVSPEEAKGLVEDGIKVMPLPFPVVPPSKRN